MGYITASLRLSCRTIPQQHEEEELAIFEVHNQAIEVTVSDAKTGKDFSFTLRPEDFFQIAEALKTWKFKDEQ